MINCVSDAKGDLTVKRNSWWSAGHRGTNLRYQFGTISIGKFMQELFVTLEENIFIMYYQHCHSIPRRGAIDLK